MSEVQCKPKGRHQGHKDTDNAGVGLDPILETGSCPENFADGEELQIHNDRGRGEIECADYVEDRQLIATDG